MWSLAKVKDMLMTTSPSLTYLTFLMLKVAAAWRVGCQGAACSYRNWTWPKENKEFCQYDEVEHEQVRVEEIYRKKTTRIGRDRTRLNCKRSKMTKVQFFQKITKHFIIHINLLNFMKIELFQKLYIFLCLRNVLLLSQKRNMVQPWV